MSDPSRKLKNPLLTAAGHGYPFDTYHPETLLVPVTPAEPPPDVKDGISVPTTASEPAHVNPNFNQFQPQGDINLSPSAAVSTAPSGYFTSILSSLPNLSITSITGQAPRSDPPASQFYGYSAPDIAASSTAPSASPAHCAPPPVQPPLQPPSPLNITTPVTYRLGNRRLKYAPPPNLTSTAQKPHVPFDVAPSNIPQNLFQPNYSTSQQNIGITEAENFTPQVAQASVTSFPPQNPVPTFPPVAQSTTLSYFTSKPAEIPPAAPVFPNLESEQPATITPATFFDVTSKTVDVKREVSPIFTPADPPVQRETQTPRSDTTKSTWSDNLSTIPLTQDEPSVIYPTAEGFPTSEKSLINLGTPLEFYNPTEFASATPVSPLADETPLELPQSAFDPRGFQSSFSVTPVTAMPEPTGCATLNPTQISVNPLDNVDTLPQNFHNLAAGKRMPYRPVYYHWFYRREVETKVVWHPFSMNDSLALEDVYNSNEITPETKVPTDGGRYDVEILKRTRSPVYWAGTPNEVRRSSWFYKGSSESRYVPYEENISSRLEEEFKQACLSDRWNRRVELNNGEYIIFHSATIQVHYLPASSPELVASWGTSSGIDSSTYLQGASMRPKVVKRGVDEFHIDEGEPERIDHLLFLVHGIGSVCDLKFRTVEEVVDEFRSISLQLVQSHYRTASTHGIVSRIEVLPISWHATLHSEDTGIDKKLQAITLESIPKLRHFTNDTLLDVLFYTSPIYCQTIMQTVGNEMNRLYGLFTERNANFSGSVCLGGHSLGSLILFDLLCHQKPPVETPREETATIDEENESDDTVSPMKPVAKSVAKRQLSRKVSYVMGAAGTGQPFIIYPALNFQPKAFFALGSPIGMFVTVRGIDNLGEDFKLPTCPAFFNIFHPFDPVAYRVESLIYPDAHKYRPMLIPHHKGRKRMHLELKETMARVGADLKQRLLDSVRSTWNSVYQLAMFHRTDNQTLEQEIDKVVEEQFLSSARNSDRSSLNSDRSHRHNHDDHPEDVDDADIRIGQLNKGRRVDYVLQEAPLEYINEYIFALTSHVCYWESEDTMLLILKELYGSNGIQADAQIPQQIMSTDRESADTVRVSGSSVTPGSGISSHFDAASKFGPDPTAPMSQKPIGPPPIAGFVRKL